jgi:branched-chain amino acid transport system substrate-binding protein
MSSRSTRDVLRRRTVGSLFAVLGVFTVLAACSSDNKTTTTAPTSASAGASADTTSPAPKGTPIKVVALVDQSSPQSAASVGAGAAAKAWADYTNAHGGVADHPITLDLKDTKGDPPTAQALAQAAVADPSVVGLLIADPASESSFAKLVSDSGLAIIGGIGYSPAVWSVLPNVFGITTTFPSVVNEQVIAAQKVGAKTVGTAACAEVDSCAGAIPVFQAAATKLGLAYTGTVRFAASATNFTAECLQFINNKTDFVQISGGGVAATRLMTDCDSQGYTGTFGASAGSVTPGLYKEAKGVKLTGGLNAFPWFVDDAPVKKFRDVMAAGKVDEKSYATPGGPAGYATMELFKKALENSKATLPASPTRADIITAYGTIKNETLEGLLAQPTTYTANAPAPKVSCFWLYTYENDTFAADFKPTCDS